MVRFGPETLSAALGIPVMENFIFVSPFAPYVFPALDFHFFVVEHAYYGPRYHPVSLHDNYVIMRRLLGVFGPTFLVEDNFGFVMHL